MKCLLIYSLFCISSILGSFPHNKWEPECHGEDSSLYDDLWNNNKDVATETLRSKFLQSMQDGSLPAESYMKFTMQDFYYLIEVTKLLDEIRQKKELIQDLQDFFNGRFKSYKMYTDTVLQNFSLQDPRINPQPVMVQYLKTYHKVKDNNDPIYFAVALLPCSRLWAYLGDNLSINKNNAYFAFKRDNQGYDPAKHFKPLLDKYEKEMDRQLANKIFREQMENENNFFQSSLTKGF